MIQGSTVGFMNGLGDFFNYLTKRRDQKRDLEEQQKYRQALIDDERKYQQALRNEQWQHNIDMLNKQYEHNNNVRNETWAREDNIRKETNDYRSAEAKKDKEFKKELAEIENRNNINNFIAKQNYMQAAKNEEERKNEALNYGMNEAMKVQFNPAIINALMNPTLGIEARQKENDANIYDPTFGNQIDYESIMQAIMPEYQGNVGRYATSPKTQAIIKSELLDMAMSPLKKEQILSSTELNKARTENYNARTYYKTIVGKEPTSEKEYERIDIKYIDSYIREWNKEINQKKKDMGSALNYGNVEGARQINEKIRLLENLVGNATRAKNEIHKNNRMAEGRPYFNALTGNLENGEEEVTPLPTFEISSPNGGQSQAEKTNKNRMANEIGYELRKTK